MDIREKLAGLLKYAGDSCFNTGCMNCSHMKRGFRCKPHFYADILLTNGVTVQEWIPVSERLPEEGEEVLSYRRSGCRVESLESISRNCWEEDMFSYYPVTHWMPLPTPPKGE